MRLIIDSQTDPYLNLAGEEYLFLQYNRPVFRLWRNDRSIIVGRNQNTLAQINVPYVRQHRLPVVRRLTGGGAVFHDAGNINFTFAVPCPVVSRTTELFARYTQPIVEALRAMGIPVALEGRNDLRVNGYKVSGNALALHRGRLLLHGTLLYSANLKDLSSALIPKRAVTCFEGKAVESHPARTANLIEFMACPLPADVFMAQLSQQVQAQQREPFEPEPWSAIEQQRIEQLCRQKYTTYEWNYGESPAYNFSQTLRFTGGEISVFLTVREGIIVSARIYGDYFCTSPTQTIEAALAGCPHQWDKIKERLDAFDFSSYFGTITPDEFARVIC